MHRGICLEKIFLNMCNKLVTRYRLFSFCLIPMQKIPPFFTDDEKTSQKKIESDWLPSPKGQQNG